MEAVVDQLDSDARILHGRRDRARLAVVQSIHRVEHVGHDARAGVETGLGGLVIGVAVADGRHDARLRELLDGADAVRQLGRDGDLADAAVGSAQQLVDELGNRVLEALGIMSALAGERQERTFEMGTEHVGALVHLGANVLQVRADHVDGVGDQRQHLPGRAVHGVAGTRDVDAFRTVIEGMLPCAMRVNVHIARGDQLPGRIDDGRLVGRIKADGTTRRLERLVVGAGGDDDTVRRGQPEMILDAARIHLAGTANGDATRLALQRISHPRDDLFS